jgi:hypothetical protein
MESTIALIVIGIVVALIAIYLINAMRGLRRK